MKTELLIKGTHCESCKALIEDVAKDTAGINSCTVDFETGKTVIEHDTSLNWSGFEKEIASLGAYRVIRDEKPV